MKKEILDFISGQRVCVVAVEMLDGAPHAATVHFAFHKESGTFIVQTNPKYRKAEPLQQNEKTRVSVVIGLEEMPEGKDKTFQLDGEAQLIESNSELVETYFSTFPEKRGKWAEDIFFKVTPSWWRFTDWGRPEGKTILNSDGTVTVKGVLVN
jgi:uncharacterized protein YhbP (UPF0306 family)